MARTRQAPKTLTASHLSKIDNLSKHDAHKGEMARFYAWQWLRMESLALNLRLHSKPPDTQQEAYQARVLAELFFLIGCGPRPETKMVVHQGLLPLHAMRHLSVVRLQDGQLHNFPARIALSIDPSQNISLVLENVKRELIAEQKKRNIRKAAGPGMPLAFPRMWLALQYYEKSRRTRKLWAEIPGMKSENEANELIRTARKMVKAATSGIWEQSFPLR